MRDQQCTFLGGKNSSNPRCVLPYCGTRLQVWRGMANKTSGGLKKKDLVKNKWGRIVSRKKYHSATNDDRLVEHGYGPNKNRVNNLFIKPRRKTQKRRGGFIIKPKGLKKRTVKSRSLKSIR
tara:strand:- start:2 stop:367 length:366 start_codon:yes stop_codon:yes gene_type:complete